MDHQAAETYRHRCAACFRQFNRIEHLVDHMRVSFHSVHEPTCTICHKHCRSLDSLREHLIGPLPKLECHKVFSTRGCKFCLAILDSPNSLRLHHERFHQLILSAQTARLANLGINRENSTVESCNNIKTKRPEVMALACKMVGGGSDGSLDICARLCLINENENIIFSTYIKPTIPVTNYRYESTGIRPENLRDGMPLKQVQKKIQDIVCNGEAIWKIRPGILGKARILVGHGLEDDLKRLQLDFPSTMIRDIANYPPLMKTSKLSNSLQYLSQVYLGYEIQNGTKSEAYEECVASMKLYLRMRSQSHRMEDWPLASDPQNKNNFSVRRQSELERMTPEQMMEISRSDYYCWCLDSRIRTA